MLENMVLRYSGLLRPVFGLFLPDEPKEHSTFVFQAYESIHGFITMEIKAVRTFETSGRNYASTRRNNPEGLVPQHENGFEINGES